MKRKAEKEILFELDGPGVRPETVDPVAFMRLAESFLRIMLRVADAQGVGLTFQGLEVREKCAALAVKVSSVGSARLTAQVAGRVVRGTHPAPRGAEGLVGETRKLVQALNPGTRAGMRIGRQTVGIKSPEPPKAESPWETTELRVCPLWVSARGDDPRAELASASEALPFTLKLSIDHARQLGGMLRKNVDVLVRVCRGADGRIADGRVVEVFELEGHDVAGTWRRWFADVGDWDAVDDVGEALGRD
jgi:hypothetical protein